MASERSEIALNVAQTFFNAFDRTLVYFTRVVNMTPGRADVDRFIDAAHGAGHRLYHHGLENLPAIYSNYGASGVRDYFYHGFKDVMSPDGMPIPYAREIGNLFGLRPMQTVHWLGFNVGHLLAGGFSVWHSFHSYECIHRSVTIGHMPPRQLAMAAMGAFVKVGFGVASTNIVSLSSGLVDLSVVAYGLSPFLERGASYFREPEYIPNFILVEAPNGDSGQDDGKAGNRTAAPNTLGCYLFAVSDGVGAGVAISAIASSSVVIGVAAVGGYIAGQQLYKLATVGSDSPPTDEPPFFPDFLTEAY